MKRLIVLLLAAACLAAAYLSGHSQQPLPVPIRAATKVGVVNMGKIYTRYERVGRFKAEIERKALPYKEKQRELQASAEEWKAIRSSTDDRFSPETKEMALLIIVECTRRLEDLDIEFKKVFARKFEEQMVDLDAKIQEAIGTYSRVHGYQLILAFGEPDTPLTGLTEFRRKMAVIDKGGMTVAHAASRLDVSDDLVAMLNRAFREQEDGQ